METVTATIMKFIFSNDTTSFKVMVTRTHAGKSLIIAGEFGPEIIPETIAIFHGNYTTHAKYGHQFKALSYGVIHNAQELASIKIFLDSIADNVGPERSSAIITHFGTETLNIIENTPERLTEVDGIGKIIAKSISNAWQENRQKWSAERIIYSLRAFLLSLGLRERRIKKVLAFFGGRETAAEQAIKDNPYSLIELDDFGFTTVDFIARQLGTPEESPQRLKAFIIYLMDFLCPSNGHLFLSVQEILEYIEKYAKDNNTKFLGRNLRDFDVYQMVRELVVEEKLIFEDNTKVYAKKQFNFEKKSAELLANFIKEKSDLIFLNREKITAYIETFEHEHNWNLSDEQKKALYYFAEEKVFVITGLPGTGKCLGKDTPVMLFDGNIKMVQDIRKEDLLMGDDSTPRQVLSTCQGREELFKVTPTKGDPFIMNGSHILSLKCNGNTKLVKKNCIIDIPYFEYIKLNGNNTHHLKLYRVPLNFPDKDVPIDPYLYGYWLGNGYSRSSGMTIPFKEAQEYISSILQMLKLDIKKNKGTEIDFGISCINVSHKKNSNPFLNFLKNNNLIKNKHILDLYKFNSSEKRLRLLAGIIDSDGSYNHSGVYDYSSKSPQLMKDVVFLARSLGFSAYPQKINKTWNSFTKGKHYQGKGIYFRTAISGNLEKIPCIVEHKKSKKRQQIKDVLVTGFKIESIGDGDYFGFELDGNGRFLLGDFTVTHNTAISKAIVSLTLKLGLSLTCMTPTGISAKKLSSVINYDAYTIHRRLGFKGNTWSYGENSPYDTDVCLVDESSMIDMEVFYRLLSALKKRTHLIFVGDHNQLPSVGAGNVLRELINCGRVPTVKLDKIFRQDEASDIVKASHRIIQGDTNLDLFKDDPKADIYFLRIKEPSEIERLIVGMAAKFKNEKREFQIVSPRNDGPLGVNPLNNILQASLNPPAPHLAEMKLGTFILRVGDRIMIKKNDYENDIYNGDIGKVISMGSGKILIKIDERLIELGADEILEKVKLAYSLTCHKVQGLEYTTVILLYINQFGKNMLQRNLLYTAMTRAKKKLIVIGHGSAIERSIENTSVTQRNTILGERIIQCLDQQRKPFLCEPPSEQDISQEYPQNGEQSSLMIEKF